MSINVKNFSLNSYREISAIFKYITNIFFNKSFTINTTIWNSSFHDSLDLSRFFDWKNTL